MISIVHPLSDELLGLVAGPLDHDERAPEHDTSWRWMVIAIALIGVLAWITR